LLSLTARLNCLPLFPLSTSAYSWTPVSTTTNPAWFRPCLLTMRVSLFFTRSPSFLFPLVLLSDRAGCQALTILSSPPFVFTLAAVGPTHFVPSLFPSDFLPRSFSQHESFYFFATIVSVFKRTLLFSDVFPLPLLLFSAPITGCRSEKNSSTPCALSLGMDYFSCPPAVVLVQYADILLLGPRLFSFSRFLRLDS